MKFPSAVFGLAVLLACSDATEPTSPPAPVSFTVSGTVRDADGIAIAGAQTALFNANGLKLSAVTSDQNGRFSFAKVKGEVAITAEKDGFYFETKVIDVATDLNVDITLTKLDPTASIPLGVPVQAVVLPVMAPCDPIGWDAQAPCRVLRFTPPTAGTVSINISWTGSSDLDAVLFYGGYLAVSRQTGTRQVALEGDVKSGRIYEIRVSSYYAEVSFQLVARFTPAS